MFADAFDGFSGFSTRYLEAVREEYPKTPVILFSTTDNPNSAPTDLAAINRALFLAETAKLDCTTVAMHPGLALDCLPHARLLSVGALSSSMLTLDCG